MDRFAGEVRPTATVAVDDLEKNRPNCEVRDQSSTFFLGFRVIPVVVLMACCGIYSASAQTATLDVIRVSDDGRGFVGATRGATFLPWGFNYDHDRDGRLLEDYWVNEWETVVADFREMRELGANTVRIHLQLGKFLTSPNEADAKQLERLKRLVKLAEDERLYLDLTGLGCYHKADVPAWYDALDESARWEAQAVFWDAIARVCADSPAIFCYDLMNEPVSPAGKGPPDRWLGPPFAGKHFVQYLATDQAGRARPQIAIDWIKRMTAAIRRHDRRHLVTVGLVDWSLDRPGLTSGLIPDQIAPHLDFLCVHLYPSQDKRAEDLETLAAFARCGKPVVIEETFPLRCRPEEFRRFLRESRPHAAGYLSFYWGETPQELERRKGELAKSKRSPEEQLRDAIGISLQLESLAAFRDAPP